MKKWFVILGFIPLLLLAGAGEKKGKDDKPTPDPNISQKDNDFIDRQDEVFLDSIAATLAMHPPVADEGSERRYAKMLMDAVLHDQYAAYRKPVKKFFNSRIDSVINELEHTRTVKGAIVWKIYNMGFIVRTQSVTIAFDLVSGISSGSKGFALSGEAMDRLARQCDILFISHRHGDHAEKDVAGRFLAMGKPVVSPDEVWKDDKLAKKILHPVRDPRQTHRLDLPGGKSLSVVVFPGHQMTSADVNVVLVKTPEGISIAHLGDQINEGSFMSDFVWIDKVSKSFNVDIMIPNCWTTDLLRIARGFNPALIIPGHENELGHEINDRVPSWGDEKFLGLNNSSLGKAGYPVVSMLWGESYRYTPGNIKKK